MGNLVEFAEWLQDQLNQRGLTQTDLARRTGIGNSQISRIVRMERGVGPESAKAIARAFGIKPEVVFRKAGLLPPAPEQPTEQSPDILEMIRLYNDLEDADQQEVLAIIRTIVKEKKARYEAAKKGTPATQS
jgi:transcriptional regulator with XRE-family HTH domain